MNDRKPWATGEELATVRQDVDEGHRKARRGEQEDLIVESPRALKLRSPNGHYWALTVNDAGALTAVDTGLSPR